MSTEATYFWKNGEVVVVDKPLTRNDFARSAVFGFLYCPCVDTFQDETGGRYGQWEQEGGGWIALAKWISIPPEELPKEFRMHLLLMGVS